MPALHHPPPKPTELELFTGYLALAVADRIGNLTAHASQTHPNPERVTLIAVYEALVAARKEMGWA